MDSFVVAWSVAVWLGILTSLSPCPLATNVTAVSYIGRLGGRPRFVLSAGLLYTAGRALAYILLCVVSVRGLLSIPTVSFFLQKHMGQLLGPLLMLTGIFLTFSESFSFNGSGGRLNTLIQKLAVRGGLYVAGPMGFLFALSLCPVSAALFFGSLVPLAIKHQSSILLPIFYGTGTAIPAVIVSVALALGGGAVGRAFHRMSAMERWARWITTAVFLAAGGYLTIVSFRRGF